MQTILHRLLDIEQKLESKYRAPYPLNLSKDRHKSRETTKGQMFVDMYNGFFPKSDSHKYDDCKQLLTAEAVEKMWGYDGKDRKMMRKKFGEAIMQQNMDKDPIDKIQVLKGEDVRSEMIELIKKCWK